MEQSNFRKKASQFHQKIRKERLNEIFRQKRSKLMESLSQSQSINELFNQKLKEEIQGGDMNYINSEFSVQQMQAAWDDIIKRKKVRESNNQQTGFSSMMMQSRQGLYSAQQSREMRKICQVICQVIKEINDYNDLQPSTIQSAISSHDEAQQKSLSDQIFCTVLKKLQLLYQIAEVALEKLCKFNMIESFADFQQARNTIYHELTLWLNILVEISSLKYPNQRENKLVKTYKSLPIYEKILCFSQGILQMSVTKAYPESLSLISKCLKMISQGSQIPQWMNQITQIVISLYYIIGNVMSDFQPTKISKVYKNQNTPAQVQFYLNFAGQFTQLQLTLQTFFQVLANLETFRKFAFGMLDNNKVMNINFLATQYQSKDVQDQIITNKSLSYKNHVALVELSIWLSRLLLIGGWLDQNFTLQKQKRSMTHVIHLFSTQQINDSIGLIEMMKITSKDPIRKTVQIVSQSLLVIQLSIRQKELLLQNLSSEILQKQQHEAEKFLSQSGHQFNEHKQIYQILPNLRKFIEKIILQGVIESKADLQSMDELQSMLMNALQAAVQSRTFSQKSIHPHFQSFIIACTHTKIPTSSYLNIPLLLLHQFNFNLKQHLKTLSYSQLLHFIYINFTNSLDVIVPIHVFKSTRMIEQEDDIIYSKGFSAEYLRKKFLSNPSSVLSYIVHNLPLKNQQHFYLTYLKMLKQCQLFYQNLKNSHTEKLTPFLTQEFINKFLYFIVDRLPQFQQTSPVHLEALQFITSTLNLITSDKDDRQIQNYFKRLIQNNAHGVKEHLQNMTLWESQELNEAVTQIYQLLEIE